jgi:hypothetical protein
MSNPTCGQNFDRSESQVIDNPLSDKNFDNLMTTCAEKKKNRMLGSGIRCKFSRSWNAVGNVPDGDLIRGSNLATPYLKK